jgi:hypothetical protein
VSAIRFTSELSVARRSELQRLLYFNDNQLRVDTPLRDVVKVYGPPSMVLGDKYIRFTAANSPSVQTIYAVEGAAEDARLVAVVIFVRDEPETISVLYLSVHEDYADGGAKSGEMLGTQVLAMLRSNVARIKGVTSLRLAYHPKGLRIPVRR